MENVMTNGFCKLNEQEMMETDGGIVMELIGSILIGAIIDANVTHFTGKSIGGWIDEGLTRASNEVASWIN